MRMLDTAPQRPSEDASVDAARTRNANWRWLTYAGALSAKELLVCAACLSMLAALAFAGHVSHGGFYYDDWGVLSVVRFPPPHASALHGLRLLYGRRPGQVLWYAALDGLLGFHAHLQLALAAALMTVEAICLFALLRRLGMQRLAAGAISVLVLLFPFSDSLWLWSILTTNTLTTALYLVGIVLALRALRTAGWRGLVLHAVSLSLYLVGIFTYGESFAALGCLVGLLYVYMARHETAAGADATRRAMVRWALDVGAIAASLLVTRTALPKDIVTPYPRLSLHHMWLQAGDLLSGAARILAAAAEPFGAPAPLLVLGVLAALLLLRARDRRWIAVALAGLLVAIAAWAVYVPADYIYSPTSPGTGNRVNGLAAIGVVVFLYAAAMLITRRGRLAVLVVIALAAGYAHRIAHDARTWNHAAQLQAQVLTTIRAHVRRAPRSSGFLVSDWPQSAGEGVPVYGEPYYLSSALKWAFADRTLAGAQIDSSTLLSCGTHGVRASHLPYAPPLLASYGRAYLVDVRADRVLAITSRARCQALAGAPSRRA
ncbi:MAG TPA: hypothetical protein VIC05_07455 [Solirubrobacteraceae bacterium]|jgi:hypothetical protein